MIGKKILPRFFNKNRNKLTSFRKTLLVTALKNQQILLFFPTFNFSGSQWLNLRRDLFITLSEAKSLAAAPVFSKFPPLLFCSTNNHFILNIQNVEHFPKAAHLLLEKKAKFLPTIMFFGNSCVNLQQQKGFSSLYQLFLAKPDHWTNLVNVLSSVMGELVYFFLSYFSYFCFFIITSLARALLYLSNCCFYLKH